MFLFFKNYKDFLSFFYNYKDFLFWFLTITKVFCFVFLTTAHCVQRLYTEKRLDWPRPGGGSCRSWPALVWMSAAAGYYWADWWRHDPPRGAAVAQPDSAPLCPCFPSLKLFYIAGQTQELSVSRHVRTSATYPIIQPLPPQKSHCKQCKSPNPGIK